VDRWSWTLIYQQSDRRDFILARASGGGTAKMTFAVSNPMECRFIRLTQISDGRELRVEFRLHFVEFFRELLDRPLSRLSAIERKLDMSALDLRFLIREEGSLDGVIWYLTNSHGGNVHETGIVTVTAKTSDPKLKPPETVADVTSYESFSLRRVSGEWICWDFHECAFGRLTTQPGRSICTPGLFRDLTMA
jgi:hypothetical protein